MYQILSKNAENISMCKKNETKNFSLICEFFEGLWGEEQAGNE